MGGLSFFGFRTLFWYPYLIPIHAQAIFDGHPPTTILGHLSLSAGVPRHTIVVDADLVPGDMP